MPNTHLSRRQLLLSATTLSIGAIIPSIAPAKVPEIHVLHDLNCGCCTAWIDHVEAEGFAGTAELSLPDALQRYKIANGIPLQLTSCHTAHIDGYMIEGHVPAADIRRLLETRPDAVGLAVPGMPFGSPGMGPENEREAYDVMLIKRDGSPEIFTRYKAA